MAKTRFGSNAAGAPVGQPIGATMGAGRALVLCLHPPFVLPKALNWEQLCEEMRGTIPAFVGSAQTDGARSFAPASEISNPLPAGYRGAAIPALGTDARGRVVVMWELLRGSNPYGLAMAVSENGMQFSAPQLIPGSADPAGGFNGSTQGLLMSKMVVRADGESRSATVP